MNTITWLLIESDCTGLFPSNVVINFATTPHLSTFIKHLTNGRHIYFKLKIDIKEAINSTVLELIKFWYFIRLNAHIKHLKNRPVLNNGFKIKRHAFVTFIGIFNGIRNVSY